MTAAQLFQAAIAAMPEVTGRLACGDFGPLRGWLREKVHSQGCRYGTTELLTRATGRPLDPDAFLGHLRARYLDG